MTYQLLNTTLGLKQSTIQIQVGAYDMFSHFIRKKLKEKVSKRNVHPLSLVTQDLCLSACVCANASGKPQNYSLLFRCSTDTVWISPQHIYCMLVFVMNIGPKKKNQQICLEGRSNRSDAIDQFLHALSQFLTFLENL